MLTPGFLPPQMCPLKSGVIVVQKGKEKASRHRHATLAVSEGISDHRSMAVWDPDSSWGHAGREKEAISS